MHIHLCTAYLVLFCVHVDELEIVIRMRLCASVCAFLALGVLKFLLRCWASF